MKVTNYELSKKLAEIGFSKNRPSSDRGYDKSGNCCLVVNFRKEIEYVAFDLETILSELPIESFDKYYELYLQKDRIGYYDHCLTGGLIPELEVVKLPEESLVDMAAKLLLLLHERGLVKF